MTAEKADKVFQCGLAFQIYNRPVRFDQIYDIRLFWKHLDTDGKSLVMANHQPKGFKDLDECLDDMLKYIENYDKV